MRGRGRSLPLLALLLLSAPLLPAPPVAAEEEAAPLIERAAAAFALGALDEAESLLREALRLDPGNERAVKLLAEVRVERERALVGRPGAPSGAAAQEEAGRTSLPPPRLPLPTPRPVAREERTWARPGATEGLRGAILERHEGYVVLRLQVPQGAIPDRTQAFARPPMFGIYIDGVIDNLPAGPLEVGAAGLVRVRHAQLRREPPTASVILDLENPEVPVDVTAAAGEIVVTIGAAPPERAALEGAAWRPPVAGTWRIEPAGGDGQAVVAGADLPEVLAVRVVDAAGRPIPNAVVEFASPDGSILFPGVEGGAGGVGGAVTGSDGLASIRARSEGAAGPRVVRASAVAPDGSRAEFSFQVQVRTGPAASIVKVSGDGQDLRVRNLLEDPLVVQVQDEHGNPVPGVPVRFEYVEGGGWLKPYYDTPVEPVTTTDALGRAAWSLLRAGPLPGRHRVSASFELAGRTRTAVFEIRAVPVIVSFDWKDMDLVEAVRALGQAAGWSISFTDAAISEYRRGAGTLTVRPGGEAEGTAEEASWYRTRITARFDGVSADQALDHILRGKTLARIDLADGTIMIGTLPEAMAHGGDIIDGDAIPAGLGENEVKTALFQMPRTFTSNDQTNLGAYLGTNVQQQTLFDYYTRTIRMTAQVSLLRRLAAILRDLREGQEIRAYTLRGLNPSGALTLIQGAFGQIAAAANDAARVIMVTADRATLDRIGELLAQVDRPRVRVYHLEHYPPSRFVRDILPNAVFGATVQNIQTTQLQTQGDLFSRTAAIVTGVTQVSTPRFTAYPMDVTGDLIVEAAANDEGVHDEIASVIAIFDTEPALALLHGALEPRTYRLEHAAAGQILNWIRNNRVLGAAEWAVARADGALVVWAAPGTHQVVADIVEAFDRPDFQYEAAQVFHIQSGDLAGIAQALQSLYAGIGVVQILPSRLLVVIGGGPEVARTIADLDQPTEQGTFMRVYDLQYMRPSDLDRLIGQTIADERQEQVTVFDWSTFTWRSTTRPVSDVRRIPYDSLKKILVRATQELHGQVLALIQSLDTPGVGNLTRLEYRAFPVRNADVLSLAQIVRQTVFGADDWLVADTAGRRLLVWVTPTTLAKLDSTFWETFDKPEFRFGKYRIVPITYGQTFLFFGTTFDVAATIEAMFPDVNAISVNLASRYFIVMQGPEDRMEEAVRLIEQIDQPAMRAYKMRHIPPSAFIRVINRVIFEEGGVRNIFDLWTAFFIGGDRTRERFRALPIDADSTLIVVARPDEPEVLSEIDAAYNYLDTTASISILTGEATARTYELDHAKAAQVIDWIRVYNLIGAGDYAIVLGDRTFILWAAPGVQAVVAEALPNLDYAEFEYERHRLIRPRYATVADVQAAIEAAYTDVQVTALSGQRALLVIGAKDRLDAVEALVGSIDRDGFVVRTYTFRRAPLAGLQTMEGSGLTLVGGEDFRTIVQNIMTGSGGGALSFAGRGFNTYWLWGPAHDVNRAIELMRSVDEGWKEGFRFEVVPVRHMAVQEVLARVAPLFPGHFIEMVPDSSINAALLLAPPDRIEEMKGAIETFDTVVPMRVVRIENNQAAILTMLAAVFRDLQVVPIRGDVLVLRGRADRLEEAVATIRTIDVPRLQIYRFTHIPPSRFAREIVPQVIFGNQPSFVPIVQQGEVATTARLTVFTFPRFTAFAFDGAGLLYVQAQSGDERVYKEIEAAVEAFDTPAAMALFRGELEVRRYALRHADPEEAADWLRANGLLSSGDWLFLRDGAMVIWASHGDHQVLAETLRAIDVPDFTYRTYEAVTLRFRNPATAAAGLASLFPDLTVAPLGDGNQLLLSGDTDRIAAAKRYLRRLGEPADEGAPPVMAGKAIQVRNVDPTTMAGVLQALYADVPITPVDDAGAVLVGAEGAVLAEIRTLVASLDQARHTAIRPLKYYSPQTIDNQADITNLTTLLSSYLSTTGTLQYDRQANAFLITDGLERVNRVLEILDALDRPPEQFLIEAAIAEVNLSSQDDLGVSWSISPDLSDIRVDRGEATISFSPTAPSVGAGNFSIAIVKANLTATLRAALQERNARVMSAPKVVTRNNVQANINVSQNVPFTTTTTAGNPPVTTTSVNFQEIPTTLTVTPTSVDGSEIVRLTVQGTIAVVAGAPTASGVLPTNQRTVQTTVDVPDGHTLIIGGLISQTEFEQTEKVPLLGDIPGLGNLFRSRSSQTQNVEVLIFLSPRKLTSQNTVLHMETELNRFRYLVNFPVDWTGQRFRAAREMGAAATSLPVSRAPVEAPAASRAPAPVAARSVDVNWATSAELAAIPGMPEHVARLIVLDRQARGSFASVEDVRRVPGVTEAVFAEIRPYLRAERVPQGAAAPPAAPTPAAYAPPPVAPAPAAPTAGLVDVNAATVEALAALPGIDEFQARMIVAYRGSRGGFASLDDLVRVPGVTAEALAEARPYLTLGGGAAVLSPPVANAPVTATPGTIDLNRATAEELMTLPGIEDFHARMIVAYRTTYGPFASVEALGSVPGITPEILERVRPRLSVGGAAAVPAATGRLDINRATEADLAALPGLDSYYAKLIVAYRNYYGAFASVDDLLKVPGLTSEMLDRFRDRVTAGGG